MIPVIWLEEAAERIKPYIKRTALTNDAEQGLYLKWENHQVTGSFKARGAINKTLTLQAWELARGLVAASAGNHGQGVALAGTLVGAPVTIFCSEHAVPVKIEAMQALGAQVRLVAGGYSEAERIAISYAASTGATWISPYNDGQVIAGQGTLALEVLQQKPDLAAATWVVPAGGGGLLAGVVAALSTLDKQAVPDQVEKVRPPGKTTHRLVAVQSEASPFLHGLYHRGTQAGLVELPSLADGLAGMVEDGSVTIPLARSLVDDFLLVSEADIAQAIAFAWRAYGEIIEGSAAAALAAVLSGKVAARPAVVVISGGNIQPELHARILEQQA